MKKIKWLTMTVASAALVLMLAACSSTPAATVNGTPIPEKEVTDAIEAMRSQSPEWADPAQWASILSSSGLTPETLRDQVIDSKARNILVKQEADAKGITVDQATIDQQITETKQSIGGDDQAWTDALKRYGYPTEDDYRNTLTVGELTNQLYEAYVPEPEEGEFEEYVVSNLASFLASQQAGGAVSDDSPGAPTATGEPAPALDEAAANYKIPDDGVVVFADVPQSLKDQLKGQWELNNKAMQFQTWLDGLVDSADIQTNPMPENVPYNVDMSLATDTSESGSEDESTVNPGDNSSPEAVAAALSAGLEITDDVVGEGDEAVSGTKVSVLYTGTLEDGTVFDSTANRNNTPFEFNLGSGQVIKGWEAGLVGMKVGGKRHLVIPPSLGYGSQANGSIPADSTLIFDVELITVTAVG
jgi:FKBP-type peptidyl-prolyl cis-trans isomerase